MWHQFYELAGVDITKEAMEVGPTCHYVMGGVEVEPDTAAAVDVPGLFAAGEVAGGMHGSNRLGGNSLSDLLVFGRRAGMGAVEYVKSNPNAAVSEKAISDAAARIEAPFSRAGGENSYSLHAELQERRVKGSADRALNGLDRLGGFDRRRNRRRHPHHRPIGIDGRGRAHLGSVRIRRENLRSVEVGHVTCSIRRLESSNSLVNLFERQPFDVKALDS
jgi:hypothetical protein